MRATAEDFGLAGAPAVFGRRLVRALGGSQLVCETPHITLILVGRGIDDIAQTRRLRNYMIATPAAERVHRLEDRGRRCNRVPHRATSTAAVQMAAALAGARVQAHAWCEH